MTEKNNFTKNTTAIKFNNPIDVYNAIQAVTGINVRYTTFKQTFELNGKKVPEYLASDLKKAGLNIETVFDWRRENDFEKLGDVTKFFGLSGYCTVWGSALEIVSHQITKFDHKREARKVYRAFKDAGFECSHECETELTSSSC